MILLMTLGKLLWPHGSRLQYRHVLFQILDGADCWFVIWWGWMRHDCWSCSGLHFTSYMFCGNASRSMCLFRTTMITNRPLHRANQDISEYPEMRIYRSCSDAIFAEHSYIYGLVYLVLCYCLPYMSEYMVCCTSYSESYLYVWYSVALIYCSDSHVTDIVCL